MKAFLAVLFLVAAAVADPRCPSDWTKEELLRHEDCNKFYKCTFGIPVEQNCFGDLYFNLETWECDWQHNVDCAGRTDPAAEKSTEVPAESAEESAPEESDGATTKATQESEETVETSKESEQATEKSDKATEKYEQATEKSDKATENYEQATEKSDQATEKYEQATEKSDKATENYEQATEKSDQATVKPDQATVKPEQAPEESDQATEKPCEGNSGEQEPEEGFQANGCPVNPHIHWLLPNEQDCNQFYYCVWGQKELRNCPATLHFNRNLQVCDWPANAGCAVSANRFGGRSVVFNNH